MIDVKMLYYFIALALFVHIKITSALDCYSCSSSTLEGCATLRFIGNIELPVETCSPTETLCHVYVDNGVTHRGCQAPADANATSFACETTKCNGDIFPVDRLHCLHCAGEACVNAPNNVTYRYPCVNYTDTDSCYSVFSYDGRNAYRGCSSDIDDLPGKEFCLSHRDQCYQCPNRGCNDNRPQIVDDVSCVKCDSLHDSNCVKFADKFNGTLCTPFVGDYVNYCFTRVSNNTVKRGCILDHDDLIEDCNSWYSNTCEECVGNMCNSVPIESEYCIACDTEKDANCTTTPEHYMKQQCPLTLRNLGCYRKNDANNETNIQRGCINELPEEEYISCSITTNTTCHSCIGNECNIKAEPQICYFCNSTTDAYCSDMVHLANQKPCNSYYEHCFTAIHKKQILRGCINTDFIDENVCSSNSADCQICNGDRCNDETVEPQECYQCNSEVDPNCSSNPNDTMLVECPASVKTGCYHSIDETDVARGCASHLDDRKYAACASGDDTCKTCQGERCNMKVKYQSCRSCNSNDDGVGCIRGLNPGKIVTCKAYDDDCFVHVMNDTVVRGCVKQQTSFDVGEFTYQCAVGDYCEKCSDSDQCNNKIVDGEFCLTCDSDTDPNCRLNVNYTMRTQCPLAAKPLGCFRFEDNGGSVVKRGCLSNVTHYERSMCRNQGSTCKTCIGNDCNEKVKFQRCRTCSSKDSVNCIRSPGGVIPKTCENYLDECFVHVAGGIVTRGCLLEQPKVQPVDFQKECKNEDICQKCSNGDNCNNKIVNGEFCITCDSGTDPRCRSDLSIAMRKQCPLAVKPLGCYRFEDNNGDLVKRGCLSNVTHFEIDMCRKQDRNCKTCVGNDCNSKASFQVCHACSSNDTINCIRNPGTVPTKTCTNYLDSCFVHVADDVVTRGCLAEQNSTGLNDYKKDCLNNDICEICADEASCNNKIVDGEFCIMCDSAVDPQCRDNTTISMRKQCPLAVKTLGCYRFEDNGGSLVKRGCLSNVTHYEIDMCRREDGNCKTCSGNDCNAKTSFQRCRTCSSKDNVSCIRSSGSVPTKICKNYLDECFVHVAGDVITRGCLNEFKVLGGTNYTADCAENGDVCEKCSNRDNCNNKVIDGEFCYVCDSTTDPKCIRNVSFEMRKQCPLNVKPLGCFRFEDNNGDLVKRGCLSNVTHYEVDMCRKQEENCKTCSGNDCNAKISFQECRVCSSSDTVNCIRTVNWTETKTCKNYLDECFVHVEKDVVTRGCLNEDLDADNCLGSDVCAKCSDTANCNNGIVDGEFCLTCNSETDPQCRDNTTISMRTQCPLAVDTLGCYRFEDNGGQLVKRGCLSNVTQYERDMCRKEEATCKTCLGNDCNEKVKFQRCRTCSSKNTVNCIRGPGGVPGVTCKSYLDKCFIHVAGDVVTRGCLDDQSKTGPVDYRKVCTNGNACEICTDKENCNQKIVDGEFCLACDSETDSNCRLNANYTMRAQCPLAVKPLGCYRFEDNGGHVVKRGCLSNVTQHEIDMCRREGSNCKTCPGNDCNTKPSFTACLQCDSRLDRNCLIEPELVANQTCRNYLDKCYTHFENNIVLRGCLSEAPTEIRTKCNANNLSCTVCNGDGANEICNGIGVGDERCYVCDSIDPNCAKNVNVTMSTLCGSVKDASWGCFLDIRNNSVVRGCVSSLNAIELSDCTENPDNCKICTGNNCNRKAEFQKCHSCNSGSHVDCVYGTDKIPIATCRNYLDTCGIKINIAGATYRGCGNEIDDNSTSEIPTKYCSENLCNKGIYPSDRQTCYQCNGSQECDSVEHLNGTLRLCQFYRKNDRCYTHIDKGFFDTLDQRTEVRGCESDQNEYIDDCINNPTKCVICDANACNNQPAIAKPTLSCIKCSETDRCAYGYNTTIAEECTATVLFPQTESCFTAVENDNKTVTRGCTLDEQHHKCASSRDCTKCSAPACNYENVIVQSCYQCRSFLDASCYGGDNGVPSVFVDLCADSAYPPEDKGCYTKIYENNLLVRGCIKDLPINERVDCERSNNTECALCLEDNCNTLTISTDSGWWLQANSFLMLILIAYSVRILG